MTQLDQRISKIDEALEHGFQKCLDHTLKRQKVIEDSLHRTSAFSSLSNKDIVLRLRELCGEVYAIIARTLFRLIPLFHPDCTNRTVNFYFWPGYHSYLAHRRIFIQSKDSDWNFGVGLCGTGYTEKLEAYDDCSQARWYHFLVSPRNSGQIKPGDMHRWLLQQQPRCEHAPGRFVSSLTVAIGEGSEDRLFPGHEVLCLKSETDNSDEWGKLFSNKVNGMGIPTDPAWIFPDSRSGSDESETRLRVARAKMTAVWLHSAFCNNEPVWLRSFIETLSSEENPQHAGPALRRGIKDKIACNWGDKTSRRPQFNTWTYLALHPWPAPGLPPNFGLLSGVTAHPEWTTASQTVGSAEFLCSEHLSPSYLAVVRRWVTTVYGMIRAAEISILFHNYRVGVDSVAMLAGPYWAQELKQLIDGGASKALREVADSNPQAVNTRRFVLRLVRSLGNLAYGFTNALLSRDESALEREKEEFREGLNSLRRDGRLLDSLQVVAEEVYDYVGSKERPIVEFPPRQLDDHPNPLTQAQLRSCFLLVVEVIRTYCESEPAGSKAKWKASLTNNKLTIQLKGSTIAQRNPASMSIARLDFFLRTVGIGEASVAWGTKVCTYTVAVQVT